MAGCNCNHRMILLFGLLSMCISEETIWVNTTWAIKSDDITCSQIDENICVINCNAPYSCGSPEEYHDYPSYPRAQIICPSHASSCIINCINEGACSNSVIHTGECNHVTINIHNMYNNKMTINAPNNGDLYVNLESDKAMFDRNIIDAHDTKRIYIDCNGKGSCQKNQINAESVTVALAIACRNGNNCDMQEVHCPDNNKPSVNPECSILCDYHRDTLSDTITSCANLNIFAMNGTNQKNGIYLDCDARDNVICAGSTVYCRRDGVCDMKYDLSHREWYCEGSCGGKTFAPTIAPTSVSITKESKTELYTTQSTNHLWFDPANATLLENGILTVHKNYVKHNLEVLAYILIGCLIGVICFCICIICIACWLVERRLKIQRLQSNNSQASSVSYEYYGDNPPKNPKSEFGNVLVSGVKHRLEAIASLSASISCANHSDKVQDEAAASDEQLYSRNPPPYHQHIFDAANVSRKPVYVNKERSRSASRIRTKERSYSRKQSASSSSSAASSSSCDTVCSESDSSTYADEYGNNFNIAIKSTRPLNETGDCLETQSIAISVNTGKSSRDSHEEDEKACELYGATESSDTSYDDETCTACTLCKGHDILYPAADSSDEDIYNAYDEDGAYGSNENKQYRIEVSGPEETMSSRRTLSAKSRSES